MSSLCSNVGAELIETALTEDQVINLIKTIKNLNHLDFLLKIQHVRIITTKSSKIDIPIDFIYEENYENINIQVEIFKKILYISKDPNTYLLGGAKWLVDNLGESELLLEKCLKLLNCLFEYSQNDLSFVEEINLLELDTILSILTNSPPKNVYNFMLSAFLPNYLEISTGFSTERHKSLFQYVKSSGNIEILCSIYKKLISTKIQDKSTKFNLILEEDYWELLMNSITSGNNSITQKQALFLLSKSIEFECTNQDLLPHCIQYTFPDDKMAKIWKNYFVLVDVSNEKQLYLIQPSLLMFDSLIPLHYKWKLCLYKIFLKHSQNFVVFYTATYVLQLKWDEFSEIISEFLSAINKHEFSQISQKTFQELNHFVQKLENEQFLLILEKSLELTWTPVAVWRFYENILHDKTNFSLSVQLLEQIINKLKLLPNTFIRNGCIHLVLRYFVANFKHNEDLIKVSLVLLENEKEMFKKFVEQNEISYIVIIESSDFMHLLRENCDCWIEICKLLGIKKIANLFENYEEITDAFLAAFCNNFKSSLVEDYILSRIEKIENYENINNFTVLAQENCTPRVLEKACKILLEDSSSQQQQIVAFSVINKNFNNNCLQALDKWKFNLYDVSFKFDDRIVKNYLQLYFKAYLDEDNVNVELVKEAIVVFQDILEKYTHLLPVILERISFFIKIEDSFSQRFVCFCLAEFFELDRNCEFKETTIRVLENIYQDEHFDNLRIAENIVLFTNQILEISTTNLLPLIVSKAIGKYVNKSDLHGHEFIKVISRLILHGSLVHKNEQVDYCIYQEIGNKFQNNESPNFEEICVRFFALDSMLSIVRKNNQNADVFAEIFMKTYMENFNKRYFPHSHLHLQKLRIIQALLLLHSYLNIQKAKLISLLAESFTTESHQTSVIHLMQWLYIYLIKDDENGFEFIAENLKTINATRPSTLTGFIPILYQYTLHQNEKIWRETVNVLLPCTMGAQFKLRVYSQFALVKLYEQAKTRNLKNFLSEYEFLYRSLKQTLEASAESLKGFNLTVDFLDYFSLKNPSFSDIYYVVPQMTGVMESEHENLPKFCQNSPFFYNKFKQIIKNGPSVKQNECLNEINYNDNIQRKITPWRNHFEEDNSVSDNNHLMLVTSLVEKATNLGGLSRTCEVFGVKKLVMKTSKITSDKEFKSLSMSSENWMDIMEVKIDDLKQFLGESKRKGYCLVGAEQTSESVALQDFKFPKMTVLVLGNEKEGISPDLIPLLDYCVEIPQAGLVRSLNVHVAGAIIIWEYYKQHLV